MTMMAYLILGLAGLGLRIRSRRLGRTDALLGIVLVVNCLLIALQQVIGDGFLDIFDGRYYQPAMVACVVWLGLGLLELGRLCDAKGCPRLKRLVSIVLIGLVAACGVEALWRMAKGNLKESERTICAQADAWAADLIRSDWKGPRADLEGAYDNDNYCILRRPIIARRSNGGNLAHQVGGRNLTFAKMPDTQVQPDYYWVMEGDPIPENGELIGERAFGKRKRLFKLYKIRTDYNL